jgi:hydroxymethylpyrimidine/phosphomethylpyrimidine kinase
MDGLTRPYVLSIAGFDPSAGAGILADIKTLEANRVYGLGVCSAITFQDDTCFDGLRWINPNELRNQANLLLKRFPVQFVKVGLIEDLNILLSLIRDLKKLSPSLQFIWDPVLKATTGYDFHSKPDQNLVKELCSELFLITPNIPEAVELGESGASEENADSLSKYCHVFLKGGHHAHKAGEDFLYLKNGKRISFGGRTYNVKPKHGSGCILSSAIAAKLAKGADLEKACLLAKDYTLEVLESNDSLLGYHVLN